MALNVLDTEASIPPETPMTKDLALLVGKKNHLTSEDFLEKIDINLQKKHNWYLLIPLTVTQHIGFSNIEKSSLFNKYK